MPRALPLCAALLLLAVPPSFALERVVRPAPEDPPDTWTRSGSCVQRYYNTCNGWFWAWSNWQPGDRFGVTFESCAEGRTTVSATWLYVRNVPPAGYGFTGFLWLYAVDANGCPAGSPIAGQAWLPVTRWNQSLWAIGVTPRFAAVAEFGPSPGTPLAVGSDHPAIGPTGTFACGSCFPADRVTRSFTFGSATTPLCPGSPLFDGFCNAEWLAEAQMIGGGDYAVESTSWARLKSLYR